MEKRVIIAVVLSILIIMSFQYLAPKPPQVQAPQTSEAGTAQPAPAVKESAFTNLVPANLRLEERTVPVETDRYTITFSSLGGAIKEITLKDYKDAGSGEPLKLADIKNPGEYIYSLTGADENSSLPMMYDAAKRENGIAYIAKTKELEITKLYILSKDKRYIELHLFIKNISSSPKEIAYKIIGGAGLTEAHSQDKSFIEVTAKINGKPVNYRRVKEGRLTNPGIVGWSNLKNKYFSLILKPFVNTRSQFYGEGKDGLLAMGVETERMTIQPQATAENRFILYVGPSDIPTLKEQGFDLDETVNYGFFGGISKFLIVTMKFFHNIVRSWGLSIILLSVFLNIILFPLTMKSLKSMQKMQELHPQMEKLKAQHKDNPQKLNKEIMELYKKYKINPFSGCLPMLLQMPIFIALYQALLKSVELRCASFLWIRDLSLPDAVKIPLSLPLLGNSINILPLIMVAAMVVQQKMSTKTMGAAVSEEQKQQQKIMLIMMPIMFGFIFYNMPSGLVLYWVVNTVLTIVEQSFILKKP